MQPTVQVPVTTGQYYYPDSQYLSPQVKTNTRVLEAASSGQSQYYQRPQNLSLEINFITQIIVLVTRGKKLLPKVPESVMQPTVQVPVTTGQYYYPESQYLSPQVKTNTRVLEAASSGQSQCYQRPQNLSLEINSITQIIVLVTRGKKLLQKVPESVMQPTVQVPVTTGQYYYPESQYLSPQVKTNTRVLEAAGSGQSQCYQRPQNLSLEINSITQIIVLVTRGKNCYQRSKSQ